MSTNELTASESAGTANAAISDMKLEVVIIPVSDVDRSKEFYQSSDGGSMPISSLTMVLGLPTSALPTSARCVARRE
jgi:hypothetical protein